MPARSPHDRDDARNGGAALAPVRQRLFEHLRRHHPEVCRHWFDDIEVLALDGANLTLLVEEPVRLSYLQR